MYSSYRNVVTGMAIGASSFSCFAVDSVESGSDWSLAGILLLGALALIIRRTMKKFRQD